MGDVRYFGIRHHGPGSARSVLRSLEQWRPDCVLVEGPADAEAQEALPLLADAGMKPPVALLMYRPDEQGVTAFYPFADFSPEWQALRWALANNVPASFIDLPIAHGFALRAEPAAAIAANPEDLAESDEEAVPDSIQLLATAAGYVDSERWWEHLVEHRGGDEAVFPAISEAMTALRDARFWTDPPPADAPKSARARHDHRERLREAHMRLQIGKARRNHERVAVICGAWHVPALAADVKVKDDSALLKGLAKVKVAACWTPWTYGRLASASGYGAGVESPGWYEHVWKASAAGIDAQRLTIRWLSRVARLMRKEDLDASSAHVVEAVRLAETLATLRERAVPDLDDLNEATLSVLCMGDEARLQLVRKQLVIGERLGAIPESAPAPPLMRDLQQRQKSLRLAPDPEPRELTLDLRKPLDLDRSELLHRCGVIDIGWGSLLTDPGTRGSFKETWLLTWKPEFAVALVDAGRWGSTLESAASNLLGARARGDGMPAATLPQLAEMLDAALLANLPHAVAAIMTSLDAVAALTHDQTMLMAALPPLARILRYGNVRNTDTSMLRAATDGLCARICIGVSAACSSVDDEQAAEMLKLLRHTQDALVLLDQPEHTADWRAAMVRVAGGPQIHGLLAGAAARLLHDAHGSEDGRTAHRFSLALSAATPAPYAASWVEGFLGSSGLILLHDASLWKILADWVSGLPEDVFTATLPLLRRTFSLFPGPERGHLLDQVRAGGSSATTQSGDVDIERAMRVALPLALQILGLRGAKP